LSTESEDRYFNCWIEGQGQPVPRAPTNWEYTQHAEVTPVPANASAPPERLDLLEPLQPFLASDWETDTTQTTFSWVPHNPAVPVRTLDRQTERVTSSTILYTHPHTQAILSLNLHASGTVDEGHAPLANRALSIRANPAASDATVPIERRFEPPDSMPPGPGPGRSPAALEGSSAT
jgi:hypothetical protein